MMRVARKSAMSVFTFVLAGALFVQFSCSKSDQKDQAAVKINAYTVTANEFEEQFAEYKMNEDTPESRANFLNNLITRKLLLEEAQRRGLDTQKDFLRSIESFWEQSLLRLVVDQKVREIVKTITVTESETEVYYQKWVKENPQASKSTHGVRKLIEQRIRKTKEAQAMEEWTNDLIRKANIKIDKKAVGIE